MNDKGRWTIREYEREGRADEVKETVTKETSRDNKLTAEHIDKWGVGVIELRRLTMGVNEKEREREEKHI